jgi:hypothetical protein
MAGRGDVISDMIDSYKVKENEIKNRKKIFINKIISFFL